MIYLLEFRNGRANILVATDVAARGLGKYYINIIPTYPTVIINLQMLMMSNLLSILIIPTTLKITFTESVELVGHHKKVLHMHSSPIPTANKPRIL